MEADFSMKSSDTRIPEGLWFEPGRTSRSKDEYLIYLIPGNPSLMSFYEPFLSTLFDLLSTGVKNEAHQFHVGGFSLAGFGSGQETEVGKLKLPAGLRDQIRYSEELVKLALNIHTDQDAVAEKQPRPKIILIGHSVGAYIALEVLRRRAQGQNDLSHLNVVGAILLFPTVTEIAQSTRGVISTPLLSIPHFPILIGALAKILTFLIPVSTLCWLLAVVGGMPAHIARPCAEFVKSPLGVQQALHMARDEMRMIKDDTWDETIWGSSVVSSTSVPLIFYFGQEDHWVNSRLRDDLIAKRGRLALSTPSAEQWKPAMYINDTNIPHGFVVGHSETVAEKVKGFVEEIMPAKKLDI